MKEKWQLASSQQCRAEHQSASDDSPEDALLSCASACTNSGSILLFLPPTRKWEVHFLPHIAMCKSRVSEFPTFGGLGIGSRGIQKWIHKWILGSKISLCFVLSLACHVLILYCDLKNCPPVQTVDRQPELTVADEGNLS